MWSRNKKRQQQFSGWIENYQQALFKHALWLTADVHTAEDMVQETYYQAWRSISAVRDERRTLGWLLTILRRIVYREYAHNKRSAELAQQLQLLADESGSALAQSEIIDLMNAMQTLPTDQRDILLLSSLHGFSYSEISEQLDVPQGTVMSRISRAKQKLQIILGEHDDKVVSLQQFRKGVVKDE